MRLCDRDIYQHQQDGKIKIDPTPSYDQISGVTVDIRLGNKFRVFEDHQAPFIDLSGPKAQVQEALDHVMSDEIEQVEEPLPAANEAPQDTPLYKTLFHLDR